MNTKVPRSTRTLVAHVRARVDQVNKMNFLILLNIVLQLPAVFEPILNSIGEISKAALSTLDSLALVDSK